MGQYARIMTLIDQYGWKDIHFPAETKDWKKFEWNNKTIALNVQLLSSNKEEIKEEHISKYNLKRENKSYSSNDRRRWKISLLCFKKPI